MLATSTSVLRLEGGVGAAVLDRVLPALESEPTREDLLAVLSDMPRAELEGVLDWLVNAGMVVEVPEAELPLPPAWTHLVSNGLAERQRLAVRLASIRVTILGHGAGVEELCVSLAEAGVGTLVLADPVAPTAEGEAGSRNGDDGSPKPVYMLRDRLAERIGSSRSGTTLETVAVPLSKESISALVPGNDLVVTVLDPSLSAVRVWVNAASLAAGVPSLHTALDGSTAYVGPLVLPGEGPCYLCWRMRALACEDDFAVAMAREEALDVARELPRRPRPTLPTLAPAVASALVHDILAVTLGVSQPRLAAHVLQIQGLDRFERLHPVLPRPDCPACGKKDRPPRVAPSLADLVAVPRRDTDFVNIAATAVSSLCGLVRTLDRVPKDIDEPELPIIVRSELANTGFGVGAQAFVGCSGKGSDLRAARDTALGEALERHASLTWHPAQRVAARRAELTGASMDPRDLVLFADEQYASLPYAPYEDSTVLEWIPARSLVTGDEVWVPLLAAHLGYDVPHHDGYLFPATSNGFAAGPTLRFAVLAGLLEVVERDAFLIAWAHRLVTPRYDAQTLPDEEASSIASAYRRRGVRIDVHVLPTDSVATVALAIGWSDVAPAAVIGLGAALDPVTAARRAVLEVAQVRPALRGRLRQPETSARMAELAVDPSKVRDLEDHDLLYADPGIAASGLAHLLESPTLDWSVRGQSTRAETGQGEGAELASLVASLGRVAGDVLYVDVTPPEVEELGVSVARAIVPGFQPIHFGAAEMRLGHKRLRGMPASLGLVPAPVGLSELNLTPHPMA